MLFCSIYSCKNDKNSYPTAPIGTWKLDSSFISTIGKRRIEYKAITFTEDSTYLFTHQSEDVIDTYIGKYYLSTNSKSDGATITLLPDKHKILNDTTQSMLYKLNVLLINDSCLRFSFPIGLASESGVRQQFIQTDYYSKIISFH